jgi:excisionase family DNA binding protein
MLPSAGAGLAACQHHYGVYDVSQTGTTPPDPAALLDVRAVAALLNCSSRHVYRLSDAARMPPPVRIGALVRWPRAVVEAWIAAGCRPVRRGVRL